MRFTLFIVGFTEQDLKNENSTISWSFLLYFF